MDTNRKQQFMRLWNEYFPGAELPIVFSYTNEPASAERPDPSSGHRCVFADLAQDSQESRTARPEAGGSRIEGNGANFEVRMG